MPYDKLSFLSGIAVGRNMKSWPLILNNASLIPVEYIESYIDSYMNLQYTTISQYTKVEFDCYIYTVNSTYATLFGTRNGNGINAFLMHSREETGQSMTIQYNYLDYRTKIDISGQRVMVTLEKDKITYTFSGGTTHVLPFDAGQNIFISSYPLYMCNLNQAGQVYGPDCWGHMKVYSMKIIDVRNQRLEANLIPAVSSDNPSVGLMYDRVRAMVFSSETNNEFIPGPVV